MFKKITLISFLLSSLLLSAIPINFNMNSVNYSNCLSNTNYTKSLTIYSSSDIDQNITILHNNRNFIFSDTLFTLPAHDSTNIIITFNGKHNILYKDVFYFTNSLNQNPSVLQAEAPVHYAQSMYNSTYNLWDTPLKAAIKSAVASHTSLGYDTARHHMFSSIDNVNGYVECVYTGFLYQTNDTPSDGNTMNTEHTWPQSMFPESSSNASTKKCDLHHLYPTNSSANSTRGNLPFGVVVNQNWAQGGSKRGTNAQGVTVFEPRDIHKGDCARSMFYFCVVYDNPSSPFFNNQEPVLRNWHTQDQVSTKETNRNDDIEDVQGNRNPFVDHPEFIERIYSLSSSTNRPTSASYYFPNQSVNIYNENNFSLAIANYGTANLTINSAISSNPDFVVINTSNTIAPGQFGSINMSVPQSSDLQTTVLTLQTSLGTKTINISALSTANDENTQNIKPDFSFSIYPNPVKTNAEVKIRSNVNISNVSNIEIFNIKGQRVHSYSLPASKSNQTSFNLNFTGAEYASGVYFVKVNQGSNASIKKILIVK